MVCLQKQETKPEFSALICVFQHIFIGYLDYFQCAQAVTDKYKSYWHIYIYNSYIQTFKCLLCTNTFTTHSDRNVLIRYSIHVLHVRREFSWWTNITAFHTKTAFAWSAHQAKKNEMKWCMVWEKKIRKCIDVCVCGMCELLPNILWKAMGGNCGSVGRLLQLWPISLHQKKKEKARHPAHCANEHTTHMKATL